MKSAGADRNGIEFFTDFFREKAADMLVLMAGPVDHRAGGADRTVSRKRRPRLRQNDAADVGLFAPLQAKKHILTDPADMQCQG